MRPQQVLGICLCIILYASSAYAGQFYKWVDEEGVTHYGESLPDENIEHVAFEFPEQYVMSNPEEDYYSIQNQLQRMQERREQRLLNKQKKADLASNSSLQPQPVYYEEPRNDYYRPVVHPIFFPEIKNKTKRGCKGSRDCLLPSRFYRNPARRDQKTVAATKTRTHKAAKRGIRSDIGIKVR